MIALLPSPGWQEEVALAVMGGVALRRCARADELSPLAVAGGVGVVVAELRDETEASMLPALLALQHQPAAVPIIVVVALTPAGARDVVTATAAGLQATWVVGGHESLHAAVAGVLARRRAASPAAAILRAVAPVVPGVAQPFVMFGAIGASRPVAVRDASRVLGIAVRTLEERLGRVGMPPPQQLLGWCRALHAA